MSKGTDNNIYISAKKRALCLLEKLTLEEKICQVCADMIFEVDENYEKKRSPLLGSYRNPGHFMHYGRDFPTSPAEVTDRINRDVEISVNAQKNGIPPIENGEALHGAQWGMATCFPQPIAMASTFDKELMGEVADIIGKECACVGVRQVFAPVVNIARDCRWGRTVETFGEDVKLSCDMGRAMCEGLQKNGVIATPKHFADNYASGGRDSNYSDTGERTMREVFLPPFKACFEAGAMSVMAAYNSWDGVPCSANERLLTDILRGEWGFDGFVVSDYSGVDGMAGSHRYAKDNADAAAKALKAGLDVILPYDRHNDVKEAVERGLITEEELDKNVLRVLTAKFAIGLFDAPYKDSSKAMELVRCGRHRQVALRAAQESIVLLKNNGILPLNKNVRRIGVFGPSADIIPVGSNYSGPYGKPWTGEDAPTPLEALRAFAGEGTEIIYSDVDGIKTVAPSCDVNLYFTSLVEGEGSDRSDLRLPGIKVHKADENDGGLIVDGREQSVKEDQEKVISDLFEENENLVVVLLNGAPVDMTAWIEKTGAVIEAWYPGEQGGKALAQILFGQISPSGKLPVSFPKSVGQLPLYYSHKPSGRGYAYCDNDGRPLYPFGFGLSYTSFSVSDAYISPADGGVSISFTAENTGEYDGGLVLQVYRSSYNCSVVRPVKELAGYKRVFVKKGEKTSADITVDTDAFCYYDVKMNYGLHDGGHTLMLALSSDNIISEFRVEVKDHIISLID